MPELQQEISGLWWQINQHAHDRLRQVFRGFERPGVSVLFLREITREPGVTVSDLARRTGMVKSHVSRTIDQLCQAGYVEKRNDPHDQRLIRLHTTPSATALQAEMEAKVQAAWAEVLAEIPEEDRSAVLTGLQILLRALKRAGLESNPSGASGDAQPGE